jgi:hypothetical protein
MLHSISFEYARAVMAEREREGARMRLVRSLRRHRTAA